MKKTIRILAVILTMAFCVSAFSTQSSVTNGTRTFLGDGVVYSVYWANVNATDTVYIMGSTANGYSIMNSNDRGVLLEYKGNRADSIRWVIETYVNYQQSTTKTDWLLVQTDTCSTQRDNFYIDAATLRNYPFIIWRIRGISPVNHTFMYNTLRIILDYDDKYVGGN
jgi:hypothetical protein